MEKTVRIALIIFSLFLSLCGLYMLWEIDSRLALGVFLFMWGNNIMEKK
jgi:hypothetical protein